MSEQVVTPNKERNIGYTIIGIFIIVFAIIGVFSTIRFAFNITSDYLNKTKIKNEFSEFVYPMVLIDTPAFESSDTLGDSTVIAASIWDIILSEETSKYTIEDDYYLVPAVDIEKSIAKLFGNDRKVIHRTVGDFELSFNYLEDSSCYAIPVNISYFPYYPIIESFTESDNIYTLKVGYVTPGNYLSHQNKKIVPQKYMSYVIEKNDNNSMKIISISTYQNEVTEQEGESK